MAPSVCRAVQPLLPLTRADCFLDPEGNGNREVDPDVAWAAPRNGATGGFIDGFGQGLAAPPGSGMRTRPRRALPPARRVIVEYPTNPRCFTPPARQNAPRQDCLKQRLVRCAAAPAVPPPCAFSIHEGRASRCGVPAARNPFLPAGYSRLNRHELGLLRGAPARGSAEAADPQRRGGASFESATEPEPSPTTILHGPPDIARSATFAVRLRVNRCSAASSGRK
jgi:hypothetical protein